MNQQQCETDKFNTNFLNFSPNLWLTNVVNEKHEKCLFDSYHVQDK